jgi:cobalt-zinc-cadmium efflux system protein
MNVTYINSTNIEPHRIAVYAYGDPKNKAVVLLHAFTHNGRFFHPLAEYLSENGFYVIAPDMPGRGNSEYLKNPKNYNYWLYVDDLFLILNYFKIEKAALFGNSMGGILSILFTEKYPK